MHMDGGVTLPNYIRFVVAGKNLDSGVDAGLFAAAYALRKANTLSGELQTRLDEQLHWFGTHLAIPSRFNRSKSKGYWRRNTKGISWFRESATEHLARMQQLAKLVKTQGYKVAMISESRIGYVVYQDQHQVVAEPFADTLVSSALAEAN